MRPEYITIHLLADGVEVASASIAARGDRWSYTFADMPATDPSGRRITYTVTEDPVAGYSTTYSGTTIRNELIPSPPTRFTAISGIKIWEDSGDAAGLRPSYVTVSLLRDGVVVDTRTLSAATGWTYSFDDIPVDDGYGVEYEYSIREEGVPGYYQLIDGTTITNSLIPAVPRAAAPYEELGEEELEQLLDLFGYNTPLWNNLLKTGDDLPIYPFIFAGIGAAAVMILFVSGRKRRGEA